MEVHMRQRLAPWHFPVLALHNQVYILEAEADIGKLQKCCRNVAATFPAMFNVANVTFLQRSCNIPRWLGTARLQPHCLFVSGPRDPHVLTSWCGDRCIFRLTSYPCP
ncbi:hypothetical protein PV328_011812 [Microctonus aethiopoides]|uniref:Uncharacterized protein n=1 Tax=Microctonus aethiopoides TaxID=144406 RepID=A0AA39EXS5_9HYME|nr:hypothetical protein PV328_011812 [Microctonus aethiopoides]